MLLFQLNDTFRKNNQIIKMKSTDTKHIKFDMLIILSIKNKTSYQAKVLL